MFAVNVICTGKFRKVHVLNYERQFHTASGKSHSDCLENSLRSDTRAVQKKMFMERQT